MHGCSWPSRSRGQRRIFCEHQSAPLHPRRAERISAFRGRRLAREPVSRIEGRRDFFGRTFRIGPATLDPRPETETLIEEALEICRREDWTGKPIRILDIGTGSGCILLTLLCELPQATGVGTDICQDALETAATNAHGLNVESRVSFMMARTCELGLGPFDLVLSNPPYIPSGDIAGLQLEVRNYDPRSALDGGGDGLETYREIAAGLMQAVPDGWLCWKPAWDNPMPSSTSCEPQEARLLVRFLHGVTWGGIQGVWLSGHIHVGDTLTFLWKMLGGTGLPR